jgi:tetraacyldisaccharide-1-P 4'-kinase
MQEAEGVEPEIWITTEKDWVRLPDSLPEDMNLWILAIDLDLGDESSRFQAMLLQDLFLDETTPRSGG